MGDAKEYRWQESDEAVLCELLLRRTSVQGIAFLEPDGRIRGWNRGAAEVSGFTAEEVLGQSISLLFTPEDRARGLDDQELRMAREVGLAEDERWHVRRDGSRMWTSGVTLPLLGAEGEHTGFVKLFRNATHLRSRMKHLENALAESRAKLPQQDIFLGSIAHELRNPLAPLKTALQIVQRLAGENPALLQPIRVMDRQLGFLQRLVEDLVDLTRATSGKLSIDYSTVVLQELVTEAWDACAEAARQQRVAVQLLFPEVPLQVEVDAVRMLQVLVNLLNNAIKFTPPGGNVWVSVSADHTHFHVFLRDTGVGIGPELLPKVFNAFTQAGDAVTHRGAGFGMGLAVVREIVSLHQGTVEVRSGGEGKGSEFIVRVPLRRPRGPQPEPHGDRP